MDVDRFDEYMTDDDCVYVFRVTIGGATKTLRSGRVPEICLLLWKEIFRGPRERQELFKSVTPSDMEKMVCMKNLSQNIFYVVLGNEYRFNHYEMTNIPSDVMRFADLLVFLYKTIYPYVTIDITLDNKHAYLCIIM
jgi:hypothetical protein